MPRPARARSSTSAPGSPVGQFDEVTRSTVTGADDSPSDFAARCRFSRRPPVISVTDSHESERTCTMTEYIVLIPDNEDTWAMADEASKQAVYAKHGEFAQALADRGHKMTGGAELTRAAEGHVVRRDEAGLSITAGPVRRVRRAAERLLRHRVRRPRRPAPGRGHPRRGRGSARGAPVRRPLGRLCVRYLVLMTEPDHFAKWDGRRRPAPGARVRGLPRVHGRGA